MLRHHASQSIWWTNARITTNYLTHFVTTGIRHVFNANQLPTKVKAWWMKTIGIILVQIWHRHTRYHCAFQQYIRGFCTSLPTQFKTFSFTIQASWSKSISSMTSSSNLHKDLLMWLAKDNLPFCTVDAPAFRELFSRKLPNVNLIYLVMDDSKISILDSIRFFWKKNLDFELRAIFTAYKGLRWRMRAMLSTACVTSSISVFQWFIRVRVYNRIWPPSQN